MGDSQTSKKSDVVVILTLASTGLMKPGFDPEIVQLTLMKLDGKKLFSKCVLPQGVFQEGMPLKIVCQFKLVAIGSDSLKHLSLNFYFDLIHSGQRF